MRNYSAIVETARVHYENLKTDIINAKDRVEYIRLTALAQEAHNLYTDLLAFDVGLVYTHTANATAHLGHSGLGAFTQENSEPLDLPEFRSPYDPRNLNLE